MYRFISAADAPRKFGNKEWIKVTQAYNEPAKHEVPICPFIGDLLGYLNFEFTVRKAELEFDEMPAEAFLEACKECVRALTYHFFKLGYKSDQSRYEAKGIIARVDASVFCGSVHLVEYPLSEAFDKYGVMDGDALLDSDENSDYIHSILKEAQQVLAKAEKTCKAYHMPTTTHNPLRLSGPVDKEDLSFLTIKVSSQLSTQTVTLLICGSTTLNWQETRVFSTGSQWFLL